MAFFSVDAVGRSHTLYMSFLLCALILLAYFMCKVLDKTSLSLAFLFIGISAAVSAITALWIFTVEVYPTNVRL